MAAIDIKVFSGIRPLLDPILLDTPEAVVADNVQLLSGSLQPLLGTTTLKPLTKNAPKTIWRYGTSNSEIEHWLEFLNETDVMASPLPEDIWGRAYWTDGIKPKYGPSTAILSGSSYPGASYDLGIPAPTVTPLIEASQHQSAVNVVTISSTQVSAMIAAGKMRMEWTRTSTGTNSETFTTAGESASSIAAWISTLSGLFATVASGGVTVTLASDVTAVAIKSKSGESLSYDPDVVTYTSYVVPGSSLNTIADPDQYISAVVDGDTLRGVGGLFDLTSLAPASAAFYGPFISEMKPGDRWAVEVNGAAAVAITLSAGIGTYPAAVTPESLRSSLSAIADTNVETRLLVGDSAPAQGVVFSTKTSGNATSLRIRKINPATQDIFSTAISWLPPSTSASTQESRTVVVTYVSAYGEEGPPSPASTVVSLDPSQAVTYSNLGTAPSGNHNIATKRIYRSSTVGSAAQFQFVAEIPVAQTSYTDALSQADLGEILPSENWTAPPAELNGLRMLASGAAIGFVKNTVYLSEPNLPHAWPHKYPIDFQIVGVAALDQSAVILTNGFPFVMDGVDPSAMSPRRLNQRQACVSKGSIVEMDGAVLYASPDGLVTVDSTQAVLVSSKYFSRKQWLELNPSSFKAYSHDGRYIALYTKTDGTRGMLIFDPTGQSPYLTTSSLNANSAITAAYSDPRTDTLYLAQGEAIVRYNGGTPLTYTWRSKIFRTAAPLNFAAAAIDAVAYPVTLKVYADGALKQTKTVTSSEPVKLKSGFKKNEWQFEISGNTEVKRLRVATSVDELKQLQ